MSVLKLINNTWDESTRNLCFVNTSLQMLYSLPEVRSFFVNQHYKINQEQSADFKICNEISRIFKSAGQFLISASTLRLLVGCESQNEEICNGSQQDITLFLRLLLQQIEKELTELDGPHALFINRFWGREHVIKKFVNSSDGTCSRCGKLPRSETEDFNMLKLESVNTNQPISLSTMIHNSFLEGVEIFKMKCSECCPHQGVCPLTGNCQPKNAVDQKQLDRTPDFLFIHLLRFSNFSNFKTKTHVVPEEILTLPNGDIFKLVSIADHLGDLLMNGHYVSAVKTEQGWIICDDDTQYKIREPISSNNYIFLYSKIQKPKNLNPIDNIKDQNIKTKKMNHCPNCKQQVDNLQEHMNVSLICNQVSKLKQCYVSLPRTKVTKKSEVKNNSFVCINCGKSVGDINMHYRTSLICGQSQSKEESGKKLQPFDHNQEKRNSTNNISSHKKQKCKSCTQLFHNLNQHLSKSYPCQNGYDIDKMVSKSFENDKSANGFELSSQCCDKNKANEDSINESINYEKCRFCNKAFKNIMMHLKKSQKCQKEYNMDGMEAEQKKKRNDKKANFMQDMRARMSSPEKSRVKQKNAKRMEDMRAKRSSIEKNTDKQNAAKRMQDMRARISSPEKSRVGQKNAKRMEDMRAKRSSLEKNKDNQQAAKRMKTLRDKKILFDIESVLKNEQRKKQKDKS